MDKLTLALDWTPTINHIGFFVSRTLGFYQKEKIDLAIIDPRVDDYAVSPAKKVEMGKVDLAVCPTESLISYRTKSPVFPLKAIAAVLQKDLSAISVLKSSGIESLKDLDGKRYASYEAKYEDRTVKQMIKSAGGKGEIKISHPQRLGIWEVLLTGKADATWIFLNWEGIQAEEENIELRHFRIEDSVPYPYSPVIASSDFLIERKANAFKRFLKATEDGFRYSMQNPNEACTILKGAISEGDQSIDLLKALKLTQSSFLDPNQIWGVIDQNRIDKFIKWLKVHEIEQATINSKDLFTNELLD